jgi:DNA-binding NtrC family response regulator
MARVSRILLIDDDAVFRKMVRVMLRSAGHDVHEEADGNAGVASYRLERRDVVITDILMPEKEGLETIQELRRLDPTVQIIAMSGAGQGRSGYLKLAVRLGARRILLKPFTLDELLDAVSDALDT